MKKFLLLMIALNILVVITKNFRKLMIVGFRNYQFDKLNNTINFEILFKKPDNFLNYTSLVFDAEVTNSTSKNNYTMNCTLNTTYQNEKNDLSYSCINSNDSLQNISNIKVNKNFTFTKGTYSINFSGGVQIDLSSLAKLTINNITTETGNLEYKTFTLKNMSLNGNEYTLSGKLDIGSSIENAYLLLINENFTCKVSNTSIKIKMSSNGIADALNGKILNRTNGNKILIISDDVTDLFLYPIPYYGYFIELIGILDFNNNTINQNATAKAYFRGALISLYDLKDYLKFTITIKFSNGLENITAIGIHSQTIDNINWIITYDIVFPNTENKTIESLTIQKDFVFSDEETFSKIDNLPIIYPDVISESFNLNNLKPIIFHEYSNKFTVFKKSNFSFSLIFPDEIVNQTTIYISYIPYNKTKEEKGTKRDEINCIIYERRNGESKEYKINCSSTKSFFTFINTLKIIMSSKNVKSSLRFLENNENITYVFSPVDEGNITYINEESKTDIIEELNTDINEESKTDIIEESNTDIIEESKTDIIEESKTDIIEESKTDINEESKTDINEESKTDINEESKTDINEESKTDINEESKTDINEESKTDINEESKTDIIEESKTDIIEESKTDIIEESKTDINEESKTDIIEESNSDINEESKTDINEESKTDINEESKTDINEESKTDINGESNASKTFIELLGIDFKNNTINRNATAKAYFRGPFISLYNLKDYLKLTTTIKFSNSLENITAIGFENQTNNITNWIITYDIDFPNTENKTIESLTIQKDFVFSDEQTFSKTDSPNIIYPDVILESFDITDFKIFNISSEQEGSKVLTNSNFSLSFIFPDEIVNQKAIYLSYIPYNEAKKENENKREEISNCKIHTLSNSKN